MCFKFFFVGEKKVNIAFNFFTVKIYVIVRECIDSKRILEVNVKAKNKHLKYCKGQKIVIKNNFHITYGSCC